MRAARRQSVYAVHDVTSAVHCPSRQASSARDGRDRSFSVRVELTARGVSASTQNQALSAVLFLYGVVLGHRLPWIGTIVRAQRPIRLPIVLSRAEVASLLGRLRGPVWLMASLLYGGGLRLLECVELRVKDIQGGRRCEKPARCNGRRPQSMIALRRGACRIRCDRPICLFPHGADLAAQKMLRLKRLPALRPTGERVTLQSSSGVWSWTELSTGC